MRSGNTRKTSFKRKLRKRPVYRFIASHRYTFIGSCAVVAAALVVVIVLSARGDFAPPADTPVSEPAVIEAEVTDDLNKDELRERSEYQDQIDSGKVDKETLDGLTGEDNSSDDVTGDTTSTNTIGMIAAGDDNDKRAMDGFGETAQSRTNDELKQYLIYKASDDANQQIQDVRSMINQGCKAIVSTTSDAYTFDIITEICSKAGVPVIAVNAPAEQGYTVNIRIDDSGRAALFADYISQNIPEQSCAVVSDSADSDYTKGIAAAYDGKVAISASVYSSSEKFSEELASLINSAPAALTVLRGQTGAVINAAKAQSKQIPLICTDATNGVIRAFYALLANSTTGDQPAEPSASPEASAAPSSSAPTVPSASSSPAATAQGASAAGLAAFSPTDKYSLGQAACEIAYRISTGGVLKESQCELILPAGKLITKSELGSAYASISKGADNAAVIYSTADLSAIDALFQ